MGAKDGDILGEAIIPDMGLDKVEEDEEGVSAEGEDVDHMEIICVFEFTFLGVVDKAPNGDLVEAIAEPGGGTAPERWFW